jgi:rubredoxin-NAD+ reductase
MSEPAYHQFLCEVCGFVYDEAEGWPEEGIAPGTRWADLPEDWHCPQCRAEKSKFEDVEG